MTKNKKRSKNGWKIVLFLLPILILFTVFFLYPLISTVYISFTEWSGIGEKKFVGFQNYVEIFTDKTFLLGLKNNIIWALAQGLIQVPLALLVALILLRKPRGWEALRTIYFLPNVISTVALAMLWQSLYNPMFGIVNPIVEFLGFEGRNWLGDPSVALGSIIFSTIVYIGYFMIILLASAMNIPQELYEAAKIDGASSIKQDFYITIPMLRGVLVTTVTLAMAYGMRHFESTFLMTRGGPAFSTTTMGLNLYLKMESFEYSIASTMGVVLIVLGSVLISLLRKIAGNSDPMSDLSQ